MRRDARSAPVLALLLSFLLLAGCASKSSKFYTLDPAARMPSSGPVPVAPPGPASSISLVSVEIPDYLDRPQIVTRNEKGGLEIAEFDRWAGELQKDIARVLAETMSASLPESRVFVLTGRRIVPGRL